jgi:chromosome segregation ATPase
MAANVREATIITQENPILPIEELPFMRARLPLIQPGLRDPHDRRHAGDRTVGLVGRWRALSDTLPKIRAATLACCEAVESKTGAVSLRVFDRPKFANHKAAIIEHEEQIARLETAILGLDEMHAGFLYELQDTRSSLAATEAQQQQLLSTHAAAALQRGARLRQSPEAVMEADQLYQNQKATIERQIATAKQNLAKLAPEIEKIEAILSGVGC